MRSVLMIGVWLIAVGTAAAMTARWQPSPSGDVRGYRLYIGTTPGTYTTVYDVGPRLEYVLPAMTPGTEYYGVATAYTGCCESPYSNEVSWIEPNPPPTDTTPPWARITTPMDGTTVTRKTVVTIHVEAGDESGVSAVQVFVDGQFVCGDSVAPYTCDWFVPAPKHRTYLLEAQAIDTSGHHGTAPPIHVHVP
jgi:chitinase